MSRAPLPFILLLVLSSNLLLVQSGNGVKIKEVKILAPTEVLDNEEVEVKVCVVLESDARRWVAIRIFLYDDDWWWDDLVDETETWAYLREGENEICYPFWVVPSELDDGGSPDLYAIVKVYELRDSEISSKYGEVTTKSLRVKIKKGFPVYLIGYVECNKKPLKNRPVIIDSIESGETQYLTEWVWDKRGTQGRGKIRVRTNKYGIFAILIHIPIEEAPYSLAINGRVFCSSRWASIPHKGYFAIKFFSKVDLHFNPMAWVDVIKKIFKGPGSLKPGASGLISMIKKLLSDEGINTEELPDFISLKWAGYFGMVHIDCCWEEWDLPEEWEIIELGKEEEEAPESNSTAVYCNEIDYEFCWEKIEKAASEPGISVERVTNASMLKNHARILILGGHKAYLDENMRVNLAELILPENVKDQLETQPGSGTALLVPKLFDFVPKPAVVVAGNTR